MTNIRTVDTILTDMQVAITNRVPWSPDHWVDASIALIALKGIEDDKEIELEIEMNKARQAYLEQMEKPVNAMAEAWIKTQDVYRAYMQQHKKNKRIDSFVLLAKKRATLSGNEMRY